ncbi:WD repeat-containing protein 43 [Diorhabda sublineata]|uniref:WD repeat-containing protein 43 n=1 Tax=Diorhabda sublineata TaxID=1163346 RepID=UPI0024E1834D|nr:WD repeat-containing protein 43 [Diorhabda sublineata]
MASRFSEDGKYFARLSVDGKLKIWNACSNTFEQEFTPDFHLNSPCTCLHFIQNLSVKYKAGSPKKKKRSDSESNVNPKVLLGTTSGVLLLYSITNAGLECTLNSETNQSINCLSTVDSNVVYSGSDQDVLVWNLDKKKIVNKWKVGNERVTAVLAIPDSNQLLTAVKNIKLWDTDAKEILRTFTGHKSEIMFLHYLIPQTKGDSYFISGSKGDRTLNCWSLNSSSSNKNATTTFLMEDIVQNISLNFDNNGATQIAVTVRTGVVHIYRHTLNGKSDKPLKPKTTIQVVKQDTGQTAEMVTPIRIAGAFFIDSETICIGHGSEILLTFENISIITTKKLNCIVRQDPHKLKSSTQDHVTKIITPVINDSVHYLTPATSSVSTAKRKSDGTLEVPMEKRLENLTLGKAEGNKVPKADNVAQLLIQGLHSKDKNILKTVLYQKDEEIIRNTVKRLPITTFVPFVQELTSYIQGKTLSSQIGSVWLKYILQIHSGILMSNPELPELLSSMLGSIQNRLSLWIPLNRLKGRLDLLLPQVTGLPQQDACENQIPLLVYNDRDTSDSEEEDIQMDGQSESGSEWEEESDLEQMEENNIDEKLSESDDDAMSL